ncbi:MAG: PEP-utilizing enzyme [Patescibacteria group bacterium]|nr:PEP-utilizing enzyme [Patescibacteria group bacterium]
MSKVISRQWVQLDEEPAANFPMTLYYMGASIASHKVGARSGPIALIYHGRSVRECVVKNGLAEPGRKILERLETDRKFLPWMWQTTRRLIKPFLKLSQKIYQTDLRSLANIELLKLYEQWSKLAQGILAASTYGTVMEFEEPVLSGPLYEYLQTAAPKRLRSDAGTIFTVLTTPVGENENRLAEIELIKIVLRSDINKSKSPEALLSYLQKNDSKTLKRISAYHERFAYLSYGYSGPKKRLLETLDDILRHASQPRRQLQKQLSALKHADKTVRQKQAVWFKRLKMDSSQRRKFITLRDIGGLKRWRKKLTVQGQYLIHELLVEIARRINVPLIAIQSLAPWEMRRVLIQKHYTRKELLKRAKETVVWLDGLKWSVLPANQAKRVINEINNSLKVRGTYRELTGMCACTGRAQGHAVILRSASDLAKFDAGDIIISPATSPELVPAMRRASAIVTDAGGITSHAAIISRELGVPCVIGTKIATKVFKDGDRVEVDATKGIVKRI